MFVLHKLNMYILTVYSSFLSGSAFAHTELTLPVTRIVTELQWFGVCDDSAASIRLASIAVHPTAVANVPCNTTFLGSLSANEHGISGQVYLVDRLTYAILEFSYTDQGNDGTCMICFRGEGLCLFASNADAVFWTGHGSPSIYGFHCTYEDSV